MRAELVDHFEAIDAELQRAEKHGSTFNTLHEAWAVLYEEVDELWEIVKQKQRKRSNSATREELVQIAAMAIKALQSDDIFVGEE